MMTGKAAGEMIGRIQNGITRTDGMEESQGIGPGSVTEIGILIEDGTIGIGITMIAEGDSVIPMDMAVLQQKAYVVKYQ
jgi:hypothetical protein